MNFDTDGMMQPEVEVILQSQVKGALPISTVRLRYWKPIHGEFLTHRVFSKNASSSRAIPVGRLAESTVDDLYLPRFRKNQPGMQAGGYLSEEEQAEAEHIWTKAAHACYQASLVLSDKDGLNVHKQWANRMLEWFGYINVLVTSTDWQNFFDLRLETNPDGSPVPQDEMYLLAKKIMDALDDAESNVLKPGDWHLPYITDEDRAIYNLPDLKKVSAARCASISYETVDGKIMTASKSVDLCDKLLKLNHWSPFEHQAMADEKIDGYWAHGSLHANFEGYAQWRHFLMEQNARMY